MNRWRRDPTPIERAPLAPPLHPEIPLQTTPGSHQTPWYRTTLAFIAFMFLTIVSLTTAAGLLARHPRGEPDLSFDVVPYGDVLLSISPNHLKIWTLPKDHQVVFNFTVTNPDKTRPVHAHISSRYPGPNGAGIAWQIEDKPAATEGYDLAPGATAHLKLYITSSNIDSNTYEMLIYVVGERVATSR